MCDNYCHVEQSACRAVAYAKAGNISRRRTANVLKHRRSEIVRFAQNDTFQDG